MKPQTNKFLRVPYAHTVFDDVERKAVLDVLKTPQIVAGKRAEEFERKISSLFGKKFGLFVNSGSSANLLALESLGLPPGSEVITPILTFATTVAPIVKLGLVPVFVDVKPGTYLADIDQIEGLISKNTKALMIPSLFGNIPDLKRLQNIAKKHKLFFVEDSCDTLGATFNGRPTGSYSHVSTTSFYASHIITAAGEGGMVCMNDPRLSRRARILSGWGRQSALNETEDIDQRLKGQLGNSDYDSKFIFSEVGYNMRTTDIAAAFGLAQLGKLQKFRKLRQKNIDTLLKYFGQYKDFFILPSQDKRVKTAWMHLPLTLTPKAPFSRNDIVRHLEYHNIQTRPVFTGNILRHPGFENIKRIEHKEGYPEADYIMERGLILACHQGLTSAHTNHIKSTFESFISKF